jgi:hypothetical protein
MIMKSVVGISLGASRPGLRRSPPRFSVKKCRCSRVGTDGSTAKRRHPDPAMGKARPTPSAWACSRTATSAGSHRFVEKGQRQAEGRGDACALTTIGGRLGDILQEWSVRHAQIQLGSYFNNARVLFLSGMTNYKLAMSMSEYTENMHCSPIRYSSSACPSS